MKDIFNMEDYNTKLWERNTFKDCAPLRDGYTYFGGKRGEYIPRISMLFPESRFKVMLDGFMGSGVVSANFNYSGVSRNAIEYNRGTYTLNKCIQDNPAKMIQVINSIEPTLEFFNSSKEFLGYIDSLSDDTFKKGKGFDRFEVARAKYTLLTLSRDSKGETFKRQVVSDKYTDPIERIRLQYALDKRTENIYLKAPKIIYDCYEGWKGLNIINGSCFNNLDFLCHKENFCFLDPPYLFSKRGIYDGRKTNTGYTTDVRDKEHIEFLHDLAEIIKSGKEVGKIMLCSNFEIDDNGNLLDLYDDYYNQILLPCGFRMVVVKGTHSTQEDKNGKKKPKVEVVYINYADIRDYWHNYKYFDYKDIYKD